MPAPADPALGEQRVACEHAARCGGCPLIDLSYAEQLAQKRGHIARAATRYPALDAVHTEPVAPAQPIVAYRTRAKLVVAAGGNLGLYAKGGGHQVVDIPQCRVLTPALARVAAAMRARIASARPIGGALAPFDAAGRGCLRAIDLREVLDGTTARVLVTFVVQRDRVSSLEPLKDAAHELMQSEKDVAGVACNFHDGDAPQVLGAETVSLAGVASAMDRVGASEHLAVYGSFVQAHRGQAAHVHALLAAAIGLSAGRPKTPPPRVLDLYGGSGAMALGLAAGGARVRLVESFAPAVAQARAAAERSGLAVDTECADVATAVRTMVQQGDRFDAVLVNPPRRGMSAAAREWVARLESPTTVYVSCNPETLARDLDHFVRLGYSPASLHPIDMIPLTDEVETVVVLKRARIPPPHVWFEDHDVIVVEKGPHEPTVPQGEYRGSLFARVRCLPGAHDAVPVHRLDVGASGLVVFARRPEYVAKWERTLSSASTRTIYVGAARGVTPSKGTAVRAAQDGGNVPAVRTRYRRLAIAAGHSVLRIVPDGGQTIEIRRHLAAIGHPLLGDDRYGHTMTNRFFEEKNGLDRPFLHGSRIEFDHPDSRARQIVESPLPGDLLAVLERISDEATLRSLDEKRALGNGRASSARSTNGLAEDHDRSA
jgi:23S rRNA (uracil1939-C5)-methyltransferase